MTATDARSRVFYHAVNPVPLTEIAPGMPVMVPLWYAGAPVAWVPATVREVRPPTGDFVESTVLVDLVDIGSRPYFPYSIGRFTEDVCDYPNMQAHCDRLKARQS